MTKKSLLALAASVALVAGTITAYAAGAAYSDVQGSWAQQDINKMVGLNVMTGYDDGMFHPNAWLTRTEFSNMTLRTLGLPPQQISALPSVNNLCNNYWRFGTVDNVTWISAYPNGVYRPESPIRRVEALATLAGVLNKPLVSEAEAEKILSRFSDADQIPTNARREVATAIEYNLFAADPAHPDMIMPLQPATRADTAALLANLYDNRDIAVVQNGVVVAQVQPVFTTTGTSAVREVPVVTSPAAPTQVCPPNMTPGTSGGTSCEQGYLGLPVPYRNSADTVRESGPITPGRLMVGQQASAPLTGAKTCNIAFTATVAKSLYSEYNRPGDPVVVIVDHAIFDTTGKVLAPAGSKALGYITSIESHNRSNENAQIGLVLNQFITPAGQRIPINATIANADGILRAEALQGVIFNPEHSVKALSREISTAQGSWYGSKLGKMWVLEEPLTTLVSAQPIDPMEKRTEDIIIGVGDRLQLRVNSVGILPNSN